MAGEVGCRETERGRHYCMVKSISLKFGRNGPASPMVVETTPVTVFVGPNNSGKSKALSEIKRYCCCGEKNADDVIIDHLQFNACSADEADRRVTQLSFPRRPNEVISPGSILVGGRGERGAINRASLVACLQEPEKDTDCFCRHYLRYKTLMLDGQNRIRLTNKQDACDLQAPAESSLQVLFKENAKREEVRRIVFDAFGLYFVVDPTLLGKLRLRLAHRAPSDEREERGLHEAAVRFHAGALPIENASDGIKAFTGIITEIIAGDPHVLLIDEPEAFLHPSLSYKLGQEIAQASSHSQKRVFVATHSPGFVMGCIQSGTPVNIVRLTYRAGEATARVLPNGDILRLMRNPLLRSTGVLQGLFYESVVVTEGDADRAFYQEINDRLLKHKPEYGIPNCLFVNAQNKQTVQTIVEPLRRLGIPAAGIVDIDIVKDGGEAWSGFLRSAGFPELSCQPLGCQRAAVKAKLESTGKDMKRDGGVQLLEKGDREAANNLFNQLAEYGLFVVRHGELESWLTHLGARGHAPHWLIEIFERMGEYPESSSYVKPKDDDVWSFIRDVRTWLMDCHRKGIPD
jgi:ABC-type cobalamin/Fe3+-siderophores transport system ATPase subunit